MAGNKNSGRNSVKSGIYYPSARVMHISCQIKDKDGNLMLTADKIQEALERHSGAYKSYAYIEHDKDTYDGEGIVQREACRKRMFAEKYNQLAKEKGLAEDEADPTGYIQEEETVKQAWEDVDRRCPEHKVGDFKEPHYHIILSFPVNRKIDQVARWFGIDPNFIEIKTGAKALENALNYLVHAKDQSKYQYAPESVKASFDYIHDLEDRIVRDAMHEKYHIDADDINDVIQRVAREGMTLNQVKELLTDAVYIRNARYFDKARQEYILRHMRMPSIRQVFYVEAVGLDENIGQGGMGKSVCTHALAKQLAKEFGADITQPYDTLTDYIYDSGDASVALQQYDAQPILVLNEMKAGDMMRAFGGRKGVKELLDPFPTKQAMNIKFGSVTVVAKYIIINGIQSFKAFKEKLADTTVKGKDGEIDEAEVAAMRQFDRRFWMNIRIIDEEYMDILFNKGLFEDTQEYDQYIVLKRIHVKGFEVRNLRGTGSYLYLDEIVLSPKHPPVARIEIETKTASGSIVKKTKTFATGDNLREESGLAEYEGYTISEINATGYVSFLNGVVLHRGEVIGDTNELTMQRVQIRETIKSHFEKERALFKRGIKCLSLFFIDEVAKYRSYDEDGNEVKGVFQKIFEDEYARLVNKEFQIWDEDYNEYLRRFTPPEVHQGYFSIDKKTNRMIDGKIEKKTGLSDDISAYDLILKNKERLLSFEEPTRFIFSHSALREGWDNPNVFQICTLRHSSSSTAKRQEVGRGLRICVDRNGVRMDRELLGEDVHEVNKLTVIANESYADFTSALQRETREVLRERAAKATVGYFAGKQIRIGEEIHTVSEMEASRIMVYLEDNGYIDSENNITPGYRAAVSEGTVAPLPQQFQSIAGGITRLINSIFDPKALEMIISANPNFRHCGKK